jgi:hypothetical protein
MVEALPTPNINAPTNVTAAIPANTNIALTIEERAAQIDQLEEWSRNDDKQSLNNIIGYLASPDKAVRSVAIESTKQFGSADAIPALKAALDSTESIEDKIAYLEAIEFLSLPELEVKPTTLEEAAKIRAQIEARRQAKLQQQKQRSAAGQNPNPPTQPR